MPSAQAVVVALAACASFTGHSLVTRADDAGPDFFDLKCSACNSIVAELERNLETEKPRMNVDLRKTLAGGNQGKKIDYAVSELRTLEVLEGLCPGMRNYGVTTQKDGTAAYQRYNVGGGSVMIGHMKLGGDKHRFDQSKLESYCFELVEEHEDVLSEAIRAAGLAKRARAEEEARLAKAARQKGKGGSGVTSEPTAYTPYAVLGLDPPSEDEGGGTSKGGGRKGGSEEKKASSPTSLGVVGVELTRVKKAYRALSRQFHPDKTGGDPDAVKQFVAVAKAYEELTGERLTPYGDLYRQVCLEVAQVCSSEEEVEKMKFFFPRYLDSEKFGTSAGGGLDEAEANRAEKKRQKKEEDKIKKAEERRAKGPPEEDDDDDDDDDEAKKKSKKKKKKRKKEKKSKKAGAAEL